MTVTIELNDQEEQWLRAESTRRREAPETIVRGWVSANLGMAPALDALLAQPVPAEARAALVTRLLASGDLCHVPEGRSGPPPRPVPVRGEPVSETIIRERG